MEQYYVEALTHTNRQVIADSGEGYKAKANAMGGINSVKENAPNATVEDKTAFSSGDGCSEVRNAGSGPRAVLVVHLCSQLCDMEEAYVSG